LVGLCEHRAHLSRDRVRILEDIAGSKAKQPNSRGEESVLAAVVLGQAEAMHTPVVLDSEPVIRVVEIRTPDKSILSVVQRNLCLRAWKTAQDEHHSQARLHRRFGGRLGKAHRPPGADSAQGVQVGKANEIGAELHVHDNHRFRQAQPATEIAQRAERGGCSRAG